MEIGTCLLDSFNGYLEKRQEDSGVNDATNRDPSEIKEARDSFRQERIGRLAFVHHTTQNEEPCVHFHR